MGTNPRQASADVRSRLTSALEQTYRDGNHVNLRAVIAAYAVGSDDDALADLIDADARLRLELGIEVPLARYLEAIPELPGLPAALDTAIEMSLRSMVAGGVSPAVAAAGLLQRYPGFSSAIRTSSTLSQILCSTEAVRRSLVEGNRELPCEMGPKLQDGRGRYELRELIGTGSHGAVYLGVDRQLSDRDKPAWVALKVMSALAPDQEQRLADEAAKARRVDHPNVVRVFDRSVSDEGEMFLVYEHVRGGNLENYAAARAGNLKPREAAALVASLADGLQAAHSSGLAHCDIKPANVLVTESGQPKIADFGVAVRLDAPGNEAGARRLGSLAFMAPEQYRGEDGALTPLADVYALGGLLFWLLTGVFPNGASPDEVQRNMSGPSQRLEAPDPRIHRRLDADLAAVCRRAMHPEARRRYASAEAFARDLRSWSASEPIQALQPGLPRRSLLLAKRQPALVLMGLVVLASTGIGAGLAVRAQQQVLRRDVQVQLERAQDQLKVEQQTRRQFANMLDTTVKALSVAGSVDDWLPIMTILETAFGPSLGGAAGADIWTPRINHAREFIERARTDGRAEELEPMLWEVVLGYWLLRAERPGEAEDVLATSRVHWGKRATADDPWIRAVDAMLACAKARRALQTKEQLSEAAQLLDAVPLQTDHWTLGRSVKYLVLSTQTDLYGPEALNQPKRAKQAAKEMKALK
jgi:hypothetical protein